MTPEEVNGTYNNFYEFGTSKDIAGAAKALKPRPWTVAIDGMVEKPQELDVDALIKAMPVEERLYRHRCVEAWSMSVPWNGFPLAALVAFAKPTSGAKYVRFETFQDKDVGPGFSQFWYPWPYVEGLTLAEATNDLAFMVIGAYGKVLPTPTAPRSGSRCPGNTASRASSRSSRSPSPTSAPCPFGSSCRRPNTASGPT